MRTCCYLALACFAFVPVARAAEPEPKALVEEAVAAAGGSEKLLKLFRMKERLAISSDPAAKGSERLSVLEPPKHWWLGKAERVKEPATLLVWTWTLGALTDPESKLESVPAVTDGDAQLVGLRVSGTIDPPLEVYFDKDHRLVRIDWRSDIHRFSDWKEHDGAKYASKCAGFKKSTGKMWYFTEILEIERLKELPPDYKR